MYPQIVNVCHGVLMLLSTHSQSGPASHPTSRSLGPVDLRISQGFRYLQMSTLTTYQPSLQFGSSQGMSRTRAAAAPVELLPASTCSQSLGCSSSSIFLITGSGYHQEIGRSHRHSSPLNLILCDGSTLVEQADTSLLHSF